MDYSAAGDFGLPHIDLNGLTTDEMANLLTNYTNHQEVTTPNGTNCLMPGDDDQFPQFVTEEQLHGSGQEIGYSEPRDAPPAHAMDNKSQPQEVYYDTPQNISGAETAGTRGGTPNHGRDTMGNINAGPSHSRGGSVGTPNSGTIMATPHSGYTAGTPGTLNHENMHSGYGNDGFSSARHDPYSTPSHHPRANRSSRYQPPSVSEDLELPDASDLIIAPVRPPPSLRPAGQSNSGAPQRASGSGHNRRVSVPNTNTNNTASMVCPEAMQQTAESLIRSLEVICQETSNTLRILKRQCKGALRVYNQCGLNPNIEEGKFHWDKYIGEIRSQYDSIRDCMWGCIRYLVSRLSVWCKEYRGAVPDEVFYRACAALKLGKALKVEIDKFRYPDWNAMAIATLAATQNQNQANSGNNGQQQTQQTQ